MSYFSSVRAIAQNLSLIPQSVSISPLSEENELDAYLSHAFLGYDREEEERYLEGSSRNGWLEMVITEIFSVRYFPSLGFLSGQSCNFRALGKEYCRKLLVTFLEEQEINKAIAELKSLLQWIQQDMETIARIINDGSPKEQLLDAWKITSHRSALNSDDGDSPKYLFSMGRL